MARKLARAAAVVAVLVVALPGAALATPQLKESGVGLKPGAQFLATSTNAVTTDTALGDLECASVTIEAEVVKNNETGVEAEGTSGETATCEATSETESRPLTITQPELLWLKSTSTDHGSLALTFIADVGPFECHFKGEGPFVYTTNTDLVDIEEIALEGTPEFCLEENEETGELLEPTFEGEFTLKTPAGTPITVPSESAPEVGPSPQLTEGGVPLAKELFRVTTSGTFATNTVFGSLSCEKLAFKVWASKNTGGVVEAAGPGGEGSGCEAESGGPFTITKPTLELATSGEDSGTLAVGFVADFGPFTCHFGGEGSFTYSTEDDLLNFVGFPLKPSEACSEEEDAKFEGEFTMETVDGTPITIPPPAGPPPGPSPQWSEGGGPLEVGAKVVATSTNAVTTNTGLGKLECGSMAITAEVLKNSEKEISAKSTAGEAKTCKGTAGEEVFPLTMTKLTLGSLVTSGKDAGALGLTFVVDLGPFSCHFEGEGAFSYTTGTDVLNVSGLKLKTNELCESGEGPPVFEGDFTTATANGTQITIPAPSTPSPVLKESGVVLSESASIRAKSTNAVTTRTALGRLECGELSFTTGIVQNSEGEISLSTTAAEAKSCNAEGEPLTLTNPTMKMFTNGGDSAQLFVGFTADVGAFECPFEGEGSVSYTTETDLLKVAGIVLETPVEICEPLVGKPGFEGEFTLTTANGTQVKVS